MHRQSSCLLLCELLEDQQRHSTYKPGKSPSDRRDLLSLWKCFEPDIWKSWVSGLKTHKLDYDLIQLLATIFLLFHWWASSWCPDCLNNRPNFNHIPASPPPEVKLMKRTYCQNWDQFNKTEQSTNSAFNTQNSQGSFRRGTVGVKGRLLQIVPFCLIDFQ